MKYLTTMAGAAWIVAAAPAATPASGPAPEDERIRAIVKEVIRENPKLILETLKQYTVERKKAQQEKQLEASFQQRLKDTVTKDHPQKGPSDAPVTIIEYTDFQCPYCSRAAKALDVVKKRYGDRVRVVFKNYPLKMHKQALPAARAALAAHQQGKFWEYQDVLFNHCSALNDDLYDKLASDLGLDMAKFRKDRSSERIEAMIQADLGQARKLRLTGTPRFLVNGVQIKGAYPVNYFVRVIDRLLEEEKTGES
jgi:protein-disulfide isomerase